MRRFSILVFILFSLYAQAQTVPQGINYQAVALDQRGQPIPGIDIVGRPIDDAEIGVRITILENSPTGNMLYQEEHEVRTDLYGMFELVIGQGLQVSADPFSAINWQGDKFLQVELSIDNDGEFLLSAVQQLMTVPYAFLAENALVAQTAVDVDDADADPSNELQSLTVSGDSLTLSNGNTVQLPAIDDADADPNNEIQVLSRSNDTLYLSNGGYAVLPLDQINDADADPSNEIQTLSKSGSIISLTNGGNVSVFDGNYNNLSNTPTIPTKTSDLTNDSGFLTAEVDGSTTNELQVLSLSNDTIYLTSGGYVVLPAGFDGDYSSLTNTPSIPSKTSDLTNDSGFLTAEVDGSTSNELQALSISNDTIYLSSGGFVKLPAGFDGAYSSLTGTPSIPTLTSDLTNDSGFITAEVDGSTTNELQLLSISNDTLYLTDGGFVVLPGGFDGDYNNLTNAPTIPTKTSDLTNDSGFITIEQDSSVTNELQTLSISNDTLFLSNGGFVKLPTSSQASSSSINGSLSYKTSNHHANNNADSSVVAWGDLNQSVELSIFTNVAIPNYYSISQQSPLKLRIIGFKNGSKVNVQGIYEVAHQEQDNKIEFTGNTSIAFTLLSNQNTGTRNFYVITHLLSENGIDSLRLVISQISNSQNDHVAIKSTLKIPRGQSISSSGVTSISRAPIDYLTETGTVAGTLNPTTITSGMNMSKITVPANKVYNIRHVKLVGDGAGHRHGLKINGIVIWENESNNGDCDIWLGPGDELEHYYGQWGGANGSFSDSWLISIHLYDSTQVARTSTFTGTVAGTLNPTTITSGMNMSKITVPANKVYNIRHVKLVGDGAGHRHGLKINGIVIWENESNNGDCDIWLGPGDELEHYYGQWGGANGSFSDSWLISVREYDK